MLSESCIQHLCRHSISMNAHEQKEVCDVRPAMFRTYVERQHWWWTKRTPMWLGGGVRWGRETPIDQADIVRGRECGGTAECSPPGLVDCSVANRYWVEVIGPRKRQMNAIAGIGSWVPAQLVLVTQQRKFSSRVLVITRLLIVTLLLPIGVHLPQFQAGYTAVPERIQTVIRASHRERIRPNGK